MSIFTLYCVNSSCDLHQIAKKVKFRANAEPNNFSSLILSTRKSPPSFS